MKSVLFKLSKLAKILLLILFFVVLFLLYLSYVKTWELGTTILNNNTKNKHKTKQETKTKKQSRQLGVFLLINLLLWINSGIALYKTRISNYNFNAFKFQTFQIYKSPLFQYMCCWSEHNHLYFKDFGIQ